MGKHRTEDYKISAVQYCLENDTTYADTCRIFKCDDRSLKRWIEKYNKNGIVIRKKQKYQSYKTTKSHVKEAIKILKKNEQITMTELVKESESKFDDFDITPQHLDQVLRDNNISRKRTRHKHFPLTRHGKPIDKQTELNKFHKVVDGYDIRKTICLDETSIRPAMVPEYGRTEKGKRCIFKTDDNYVFRTFTLLDAINNKKCVGYRLYEKGGTTKERLNEFLQDFVYDNYKDNLIILDNAGSHNNDFIKKSIKKSGNDYLFSIPYSPETNSIESYFSQIKHKLKLNKKVLKYDELKTEVKNAIKSVKQENYKNYFNYAYRNKNIRIIEETDSPTRKPKKNYKD